MEDFISIITPCFNSQEFISFTIDSVLQQTYKNWELIVINDGSTDNSKDILAEFSKRDSRIRIITLDKNYGPAHARNVGIKKAKGKYIAFLDSDDLWITNKLETQISFMLENNIVFSFSSYRKIDEDGKIVGDVIKAPSRIQYQDLLKSCSIGCLSVVYDQSMIGKQYMPEYKKTQDYALWLKILKSGVDAIGIDEELALYRIRKSSISRNKFVKAYYQWKIYREQEKISFPKSLYLMMFYAFYGIKKMFQ